MRKISLHTRILVAMALGLVIGLLMDAVGDEEAKAFQTAIWWFDLIGKDIFIGARPTGPYRTTRSRAANLTVAGSVATTPGTRAPPRRP